MAIGELVLALCLVWTSACTPEACSDRTEQRSMLYVEALIGEPGARADRAETALVAQGYEAIMYLETGLYEAEPAGRARIVRVLARIGHPEVWPIVEHLARTDPDPTVREAATAALQKRGSAREAAR